MHLPVIDFSLFAGGTATQKQQIADAIGAACREDGFFLLANHGLDRQLVDDGFAAAKQFFDAPLSVKQAMAIEHSPCHRGWYGEGGEILDGSSQPQGDYKQGLKIGRDLPAEHPRVVAGMALHGANQWPEGWPHDDIFKARMQACYAACEALSHQLMQAFALSLNLPQTHFTPWLSLPMATLSPLRYPPMRADAELSAAAHTDFGCLTLLLQHDQAGLEIERPNGSWLAVPCAPELVVVNIGDMMARWTNDLYRSTRHRVRHQGQGPRHSMAFFFDPDPEADLSPLPGCLVEGAAAAYPPSTALAHLLEKIEESFAYRQESP